MGCRESLCELLRKGTGANVRARLKGVFIDLVDTEFGSSVDGPVQSTQKELLRVLSRGDQESRLLLLMMMLWSCITFPSEADAVLLLRWTKVCIEAIKNCSHCQGELSLLPPTLLGRLARCCSVVVPCNCCSTALLWLAVTAPAALEALERDVGVMEDSRLKAMSQSVAVDV